MGSVITSSRLVFAALAVAAMATGVVAGTGYSASGSSAPKSAFGSASEAAAPTKKPGQKNPRKKTPRPKPSTRPSGTTNSAAGGVRQMYAEAQKRYDAGKYPDALQMYDAILRKYPGHEPSSVQYAKTLYRLDRIQESYAMFARLNPQFLDAETSYEYGWAFYVNKQYEGGLYGFQRVPPGHSLYDLANYYGGICAIKIRRYSDAEEMLEKAMVLPDKLARSRLIYLKHAQELRLMNDKNQLAKERADEKKRLDTEKSGDKKTDSASPSSGTGANGPYVHGGFLGVSRGAYLGFSQSNKTLNFHGFKSQTSTTRKGTFTFEHGPLLPLPYKDPLDEKRQASVGVQLLLIGEDRQRTGEEQRIIIEEDNMDIVRYQSVDLGKSHSQLGVLGASPWAEFPIPGNLWAGLAGKIEFAYPEFGRAGRTGTQGGNVLVGLMMPEYTFKANVDYTQNLNSSTKAESTITETSLAFSYSFPANLSANGVLGYRFYDYVESTLDGPDSITFGTAEIKQKFPLGFSLTGFGSMEQQSSYIYHEIPTYGVVAADGQVATGKFTLGFAPFPWVSSFVSQLFQQTTWSVDNTEAQDTFEKNVASYVADLTFGASINFGF